MSTSRAFSFRAYKEEHALCNYYKINERAGRSKVSSAFNLFSGRTLCWHCVERRRFLLFPSIQISKKLQVSHTLSWNWHWLPSSSHHLQQFRVPLFMAAMTTATARTQQQQLEQQKHKDGDATAYQTTSTLSRGGSPLAQATEGRTTREAAAAYAAAAQLSFVPSIPPPKVLPLNSPLSASIHAKPQIRKPGSVIRMNEVIRHWWAVPAVGFNSILEVPVYRFEVYRSVAADIASDIETFTYESESPRQQEEEIEAKAPAVSLAHAGPVDDTEEVGSIVLPNDIFGLPLRPDILYRCYWFYRCAIAGWTERMQLYKWEWPGSKRKIRPQCRTGMARLGWRKAPGHYEGVKAHPLRPHDQRIKINKRLLWQGLKIALSAKFAQGQLRVVDHFNLQSHKTKHCVAHLRRLLGRKCPSALLVHEGTSDVNDFFRFATAHILAVRRENVEGLNVYNLLKYRQLVITEKALLKLIYNIQKYPEKRKWLPAYATPDGLPAPVPPKVAGWKQQWTEQKAREAAARYSKALMRERILKWKWSDKTKGAIKVPRVDPFKGFRLARFALYESPPPSQKFEELYYADAAPLEEAEEDPHIFEEAKEMLEERERLARLEEENLPDPALAHLPIDSSVMPLSLYRGAHQMTESGQKRGNSNTGGSDSTSSDSTSNDSSSSSGSSSGDEEVVEEGLSSEEFESEQEEEKEGADAVRFYRTSKNDTEED